MSKNYRAHLDWAKCHLDGNLTWVLGKGQARQITRMYISVITILIYGHLWAVFMINVYPDRVKVCNSHHTFWEWPKRLSYGMMNVWKRPMSILYSLKLNFSFVLYLYQARFSYLCALRYFICMPYLEETIPLSYYR